MAASEQVEPDRHSSSADLKRMASRAATKRRAGGRGFATAFKKASRSRSIIGVVLFNDASSCIVCEVACGEAGQRCCPLDELANGWRDAEFHPSRLALGCAAPVRRVSRLNKCTAFYRTSQPAGEACSWWRTYRPQQQEQRFMPDRPVLLDQLAANPKRATQATGSLHAHATRRRWLPLR